MLESWEEELEEMVGDSPTDRPPLFREAALLPLRSSLSLSSEEELTRTVMPSRLTDAGVVTSVSSETSFSRIETAR